MVSIPSPARAAASRANGARSKGPSPQSTAITRRNALRHGLTATVCLLEPDQDEAERLAGDLQAQFRPDTPMGKILVDRMAFLAVRLRRCQEQETAHVAERARHARQAHDLQVHLEIEGLMATLHETPSTSVLGLLRTPGGIQALIAAWTDLRAELEREGVTSWTEAHRERANHLIGRRSDEITSSRFDELSRAVNGDFGLLRKGDGEWLERDQRREWAKAGLIELIDEELAALRSCFEALDLEAFALDREQAPSRALFDSSWGATLARRYEANAERGLFKCLNELRKVEREAAENPNPAVQLDPVYPEGPLGSFGAAPEAPAEPAEEPEAECVDLPETEAEPVGFPVEGRAPRLQGVIGVEVRDELEEWGTGMGGRRGWRA